MINPILQQLNQAPTQMPGANNPVNMVQEFLQFKNQMQGKDPEKMIRELLTSGQMSQGQFNQLKGQAQGILNMLK